MVLFISTVAVSGKESKMASGERGIAYLGIIPKFSFFNRCDVTDSKYVIQRGIIRDELKRLLDENSLLGRQEGGVEILDECSVGGVSPSNQQEIS